MVYLEWFNFVKEEEEDDHVQSLCLNFRLRELGEKILEFRL